jgi:hypothetical protein
MLRPRKSFRDQRRLSATGDAELLQNLAHMRFHRAFVHVQLESDFLVRFSPRQHQERDAVEA